MVSARKLEANRANAAKSTGPRTAAGKAVSSMNALRHGLRAEAVVIPGELPEAYEAFREAVRESYAPVGLAEELLVEQITLAWWRSRREYRHEAALARAEVAELTPEFSDAARVDALRAEAAAARRDLAFVRTLAGDPAAAVSGHDAVHLLARMADAVYSDDVVLRTEELTDDPFYDDDPDDRQTPAVTLPINLLRAADVPKEWWRAAAYSPEWTVGGVRQALEALEYEFWSGTWEDWMSWVEWFADAAAVIADATAAELARQLEAHAPTPADRAQIEALAAVPSEDKLRPLLRYAAHNQKQLGQLLDRLERLQAARRAAESADESAESADENAPPESVSAADEGQAEERADAPDAVVSEPAAMPDPVA